MPVGPPPPDPLCSYPSGYILNGNGQLPPFPVRVACDAMADEHLSDEELLSGVGEGLRYKGLLPPDTYAYCALIIRFNYH